LAEPEAKDAAIVYNLLKNEPWFSTISMHGNPDILFVNVLRTLTPEEFALVPQTSGLWKTEVRVYKSRWDDYKNEN
jgi:hypothetical protein